jgi:hypothetical protein
MLSKAMSDGSPDESLYKECLYEMLEGCADYVRAVIKMEGYRTIAYENGREFREKVAALDKTRTIVHDGLISKIQVVNRICKKIGINPICDDNIPRAEYGDIAIDIVKKLFDQRVR